MVEVPANPGTATLPSRGAASVCDWCIDCAGGDPAVPTNATRALAVCEPTRLGLNVVRSLECPVTQDQPDHNHDRAGSCLLPQYVRAGCPALMPPR
jgi:hypothetical protein